MPFNNGSFVSSVLILYSDNALSSGTSPYWPYKGVHPQVTIACKPSSTIARFKNTEFRTSDN